MTEKKTLLPDERAIFNHFIITYGFDPKHESGELVYRSSQMRIRNSLTLKESNEEGDSDDNDFDDVGLSGDELRETVIYRGFKNGYIHQEEVDNNKSDIQRDLTMVDREVYGEAFRKGQQVKRETLHIS